MQKILKDITIMDVDPFKNYTECPNCGGKDLSTECSGPLSEWTECFDCNFWFHPDVEFIENTKPTSGS